MNLEDTIYNTLRLCSNTVPSGYITCGLSSEGKLGAPKLFHSRDFTCGELLNLSLVDQNARPRYLIELLQNIILEKDVKITDFYEKEVIEFVMNIYQIYYGNIFSNVDYEITADDWEAIKIRYKDKPEDFENAQLQYKSGKWRPKYDIFLDALDYNTLPPDFKKTAVVKTKNGGVYEFSYPKYGDFSLSREVIRVAFAGEDLKHKQTQQKAEMKYEIESRIRKGELIDRSRIPLLSNEEVATYNKYMEERSDFINILAKSMFIRSYNGKDISNETLEEKIKVTLMLDIDQYTMKTIIDYFSDLNVGIKKEVKILNPVTRKHVIKEFNFSEMEYFNMYEYNNLLTLLCSISKETNNSIESLLKMPMHQVTSIFTSVKKIFEEEEKERKKQEENPSSSPSTSIPSLPSSYSSLLNSVKK
jgi:hypothetical protein